MQIGGGLISKRVTAFLETSGAKAYIMVEEHPFRSDPSHILTHRVQAGTTGFVAALLKTLPKPSHENAFLHTLRTLNKAVRGNVVPLA